MRRCLIFPITIQNNLLTLVQQTYISHRYNIIRLQTYYGSVALIRNQELE